MSLRANIRPVLESLQRLYPKQLADSKWDNTGLLVDTIAKTTTQKPKVLLTIDLTTAVCDEALNFGADLIIAYHPFIFSGIKQIDSKNPQHMSLLRLISAGVAVYSPHTAVDASIFGNNEWLADGVTKHGKNQASRETLNLVSPSVEGQKNAGYGRKVELAVPMTLSDLVALVKEHLNLSTVQLVKAIGNESRLIKSVAMCAGSGGSVLRGTTADLWLTGELGHHEMLYLQESGTSAIVCGHSNTERGFLPVLEHYLTEDLAKHSVEAEFKISKSDRDPIHYV